MLKKKPVENGPLHVLKPVNLKPLHAVEKSLKGIMSNFLL